MIEKKRPMVLYGGLEAGGTKWVGAVGSGPDNVCATTRFATTTPAATIAHAVAFFVPYRTTLVALGIGSFIPLDPHPDAPTFGFLPTNGQDSPSAFGASTSRSPAAQSPTCVTPPAALDYPPKPWVLA